MKRLFAYLLSVLQIFAMLHIVCDAGFQTGDFQSFSHDVISLIQDYSYRNTEAVSAARIINDTTDENSYTTNRLIVKSKTEPKTLNSTECVSGYNELFVFQYENNEDAENAFDYYSTLDYVEYVQFDSFCEGDEITDDYSILTDTNTIVPTVSESEIFKFNALKKYLSDNNICYNNDLTVAIVDTGIAYDHEYLKNRVVRTGFDSVNAQSDYDDNSHGTHLAGIVAANTLENVSIKPYKVLNAEMRGTELQVYLGIQAAVNDGADIINLSLSTVGESEILHDAVKYARDNGVIVVCSAGNNGVDLANVKYSPACFDEVITVGSCKNTKQISDFSNYGSKCDIFAPGENIISTGLANTYISKTGTSMAAPFITAAVTYVLLSAPNSDFDVLKNKLLCNTAPCASVKNGLYINAEFLTRTLPKIPDPVFSYRKSSFSEPFELSLSTDVTDGKIYYKTTDFDIDEYVLYTGTITVDFDMTIYAYVVADGYETSDVMSYSYTRSAQDAGLFTVDENGTLIDYTGKLQDVVVPLKVNSKYVKDVSPTLFKNDKNIRSVMFQAYMTNIPAQAFSGCDNLRYVRAKGVTFIGENAFENCGNLKNFVGEKVKTVSDYAFYGCNKFNNFSFKSAQYIGESAFENIGSISSIYPNSIITVGNKAFKNTGITDAILNNVTSVGEYAFSECANLSSAAFLKIENIGDYAFANSPKLLRITLDGLKSLPENTLLNDVLLESIVAPDLETVSNGAFSGLTGLVQAEFDSVHSVGDNAFKNCTELSSLKMPLLTSLGNYVFSGCKSLKSIDFPELTECGVGVFDGCDGLEIIKLDSLPSVDFNEFSDCKLVSKFSCDCATSFLPLFTSENNLSDIFPLLSEFSADSVLVLCNYIFSGCSSLLKASFAKAENIGKYAFYGCSELADFNAPNLSILNEYAFYGCKKLKPEIKNIAELYSNSLNGVTFDKTSIFSNLQTAAKNSFEGCNIERAVLPSIVIAEDLPRNGIILVASEGDDKIIADGIQTDATIYAVDGSFAQRDAQRWGYKFVEYNEQTAVMSQPLTKRYNNGQHFVFDILAANCSYQWYYIDEYGNSQTYNLKTASEIDITDHMSDTAFYCIAVSRVGTKQFTITSNLVTNIFNSVKNSINSQNIIFDADNKILFSNKNSITEISDFIKIDNDELNVKVAPTVKDIPYFGTGTAVYLTDESGEVFDKYTLCVKGDANGDGIVDVLDITECERVVNSHRILENEFIYSLDLNRNKTVDAADYQTLVNFALQ